MPGKSVLASVCITVVLALLVAGCGKDYRQIAVIDGDKAELVTFGPVPKEPQKIWGPGRILVFRTNSPAPGAPGNLAGKAGHVYRVSDDQKTLEDVAEFQASMPNDTLAYMYGK